MSYEREKQVAIDAAIAAAKLCQAVRREIPVAMEKIDKSPVTVADYGSQALICRALDAAFPEDAIVGEEDATDLRSNPEQLQKVTESCSVPGSRCDTGTGCGLDRSRQWRSWGEILDPRPD